MPRVAQLRRWPAVLVLAMSLAAGLSGPGAAQLVIGSSNPATADPPVPRPHTTPCTVQLFSNVAFADFSPKPFSYTPPAACTGPWAKVVLEADFSVTAGRQFDRTAQIAIGHVNVYYGTTPEPSASFGPVWHVERDITDYAALLRSAQTGETNLGNLVNPTFTSVISGSASLQIYPASDDDRAPRPADQVLPLSTAPGGAALLATTANVLAPTLTLPANVERAFLDLITQSQSNDEFWYTCVPNDVASELGSCGGTSFREAEVTIDGQPAGVAPVYPWIFTGGIDPLLWRPIPGVQTLNFVPYRVNLTPFAGVLSNGQPHQVGVSVFNADNYFLVAGTLLLYLDHGSSQVTGAVTTNTLGAAPSPTVHENLTTASDGSITGSVSTTAARRFTVAGYAVTSHGRVETRLDQEIDFSNVQQFVVSATKFVQDITQRTQVSATTTTHGGGDPTVAQSELTYPLTLDISAMLNADGSISQTTTVDQRFNRSDAGLGEDEPAFGVVSNRVATQDTLLFDATGAFTGFQNRQSSQTYFATSPDGGCFSRSIAAANGALTSVTTGAGCGDGQGDD